MISEEAYFWRIQWAGTWMLTYRRFSEREIRREHPEAIRIEGSGETVLVPDELAAQSLISSVGHQPSKRGST